MAPAIKLDGAENVYIGNTVTRGFDTGIVAENSSGIIEGYRGAPISLRDGSDFQIVDSKASGLEINQSKAELYDTMAWEVLKITEGKSDPVLSDLEYYANQVINCRSESEKKRWTHKLKQRAGQAETYLDWAGHGYLLYKLSQLSPF